MDMKLNRCINKKKDIITRVVDRELLLMSPDSGLLFRVNELGAFVWEQLERYHIVNELIDSISSAYQVERNEIIDDLIDFLGQLKEKNLISID
jgi:hypothetical protein